jgi:regulator of sigma E protease
MVANGSPAEKAGIRRGDRLLTVAGEDVPTWDKLFLAIGTRPDREVPLTFARDGQTITVRLTTDSQTKYEIGDIGVFPDVNPSVGSVLPGDPADKAGIRTGDVIVAVNGQRVVFARQLVDATAPNAGKPITLTIRRNGQEQQITVTPVEREGRGMIGITPREATRSFTPGPIEAVQLSVQRNLELSGLIFKTLGGLFVGQTSPRQLMGPVAIAQLSGESAQLGWIALLSLMASISLNLGLLNLMPVPVLDGGHIVIMALEGIARRDFSMQVKEKMLLAGFVLLMMLMVTVIYNDLTRISWIERLMPWRN